MNGKVLFCLIALCLLVGVVSADTTIFYPASGGSQDGYMISDDCGAGSTYTQCRAQATGTDQDGNFGHSSIKSRQGTSDWYQIARGWLELDTSSTPDDATVDSAVLRLAGYTKDNSLGNGIYTVTGFSPATQGAIASGDFDSFGSLVYSSNITYAGWNTDYATAYNNFTFTTAGKNAISHTGYTNLMIRDTWDTDNSFTGVWAYYVSSNVAWISGEYASYRPHLVVVWTVGAPPDTTPPASITNLSGEKDCSSISWGWNNPDDEDFAGVSIWQNGTFLYNLTSFETYEEWYDLAENTDYTISIKTFDETGNRNNTFVNAILKTDICPTPTPTPTPTPGAGDIDFTGKAHFIFNATNITPVFDYNWSVNDIFVGNGSEMNSIESWLLWNMTHKVNLIASNETDIFEITKYYNLHNITPTITPTQTAWIPDINPSTEVNYSPENLFNYWWIPTLILVIWLLFRRS